MTIKYENPVFISEDQTQIKCDLVYDDLGLKYSFIVSNDGTNHNNLSIVLVSLLKITPGLWNDLYINIIENQDTIPIGPYVPS
jgi:hypothetical protein